MDVFYGIKKRELKNLEDKIAALIAYEDEGLAVTALVNVLTELMGDMCGHDCAAQIDRYIAAMLLFDGQPASSSAPAN